VQRAYIYIGGETVIACIDIAPLTGKIIKNRLNFLERGENLLGMLNFVFWISQL